MHGIRWRSLNDLEVRQGVTAKCHCILKCPCSHNESFWNLDSSKVVNRGKWVQLTRICMHMLTCMYMYLILGSTWISTGAPGALVCYITQAPATPPFLYVAWSSETADNKDINSPDLTKISLLINLSSSPNIKHFFSEVSFRSLVVTYMLYEWKMAMRRLIGRKALWEVHLVYLETCYHGRSKYFNIIWLADPESLYRLQKCKTSKTKVLVWRCRDAE